MPILKFKDNQTGQVIHLDWSLPHPPSERDIDIAARQQVASGEFPSADMSPRATLAAQGAVGPRAGLRPGTPNSNLPSLTTPQGRAGAGITDPESGGLGLMDYARALRDALTTPFHDQLRPAGQRLAEGGSERDFARTPDPEASLAFQPTSRGLSPSSALQTATLGASGPASVAAGATFGGMGGVDALDSTASPARRIMGGLQAALGGWQVGKGALDVVGPPKATTPPEPTVDLGYIQPNLAGKHILRSAEPATGSRPLPPLDDTQQGLIGGDIQRLLERKLNPMVKGADRRALDSIDTGIKEARDIGAGQRAANAATDKAEAGGRASFVGGVQTELNRNLKPLLTAPKAGLSDLDANIQEEAKFAAIRRAQAFREGRDLTASEQKADLEHYRAERAKADQAAADKDILTRYSDIRGDIPENPKLGPAAGAAQGDALAQNLARAQSQVRARAGRVATAEPAAAPPHRISTKADLLPTQEKGINDLADLQRIIHGEDEPPTVGNGLAPGAAAPTPPNLSRGGGNPSYPNRPEVVEPVHPSTFDKGAVAAEAAAEPPQQLPNLIRDTERPNFRVPPTTEPSARPAAPITPESIADLARKVGAGGAAPPRIPRDASLEALPSTPPTDVTPDGRNWVEEYGKQLEDAFRAAGRDIPPGEAVPAAARAGEPVIPEPSPAASSEPPTPPSGGMFTADDLKGSNDKLLGQVPGLSEKIAQLSPADQAEVYKAFGGVTAAGRNAFDKTTGTTGPINIDEAMATLERLLGGNEGSTGSKFLGTLGGTAAGGSMGYTTGEAQQRDWKGKLLMTLLGAAGGGALGYGALSGMEHLPLPRVNGSSSSDDILNELSQRFDVNSPKYERPPARPVLPPQVPAPGMFADGTPQHPSSNYPGIEDALNQLRARYNRMLQEARSSTPPLTAPGHPNGVVPNGGGHTNMDALNEIGRLRAMHKLPADYVDPQIKLQRTIDQLKAQQPPQGPPRMPEDMPPAEGAGGKFDPAELERMFNMPSPPAGGNGPGFSTPSANPVFNPALLKKAWMMPSARAAMGATAGYQTGDTRRDSYRNALLGAIAATAAAPRSASGMENAIPWLTRASYEGMLAGPAQASNLAGNIGSLAFAPALEAVRGNTEGASQLVQSYLRPATWKAGLAGLKEGWASDAPLKLAEGVQPLGPAGRALSAVDRGTRNVLESGGLSPDSAARYTFANNPVTEGLKHLQALQQLKAHLPGRSEVQIPTLSTLAPFIKTYLNQIETAAAHSPARMLSPALREAYPVAARPNGATGLRNWAEYTSQLPTPIAVAAGLGAAGAASPTASALLGPLAAPFQAGAAFRDLKRTGRDSPADTARVIEQQVPLANEVQRFVEDPTRLPGQLAQRFIPSGLMAIGDRTLRDPKGSSAGDVGGYIEERLPWARQDLPIKPDFFGQPQQRSIIGGPPEDLYSRDPRAQALSEKGLLRYSQSGSLGPDVPLTPEDKSRLQQLRGQEMIKLLSPFLQDPARLAAVPQADPTAAMPPNVRDAAAIMRGLPPIRSQNDVYKFLQRQGIDIGTERFRAEKARALLARGGQ